MESWDSAGKEWNSGTRVMGDKMGGVRGIVEEQWHCGRKKYCGFTELWERTRMPGGDKELWEILQIVRKNYEFWDSTRFRGKPLDYGKKETCGTVQGVVVDKRITGKNNFGIVHGNVGDPWA